MDRWVGKVAIVTGASSGIGEAIAETLVKAGMQVVGLARRVERVQANADRLNASKASSGKLHALRCDVTDEKDVCAAFEWTSTHVGIVHVLVNNAGVMQPTNLIDGDSSKWRTILDTNVMGLCVATREACRLMMAHNIAGHIVHINSIAGQSHIYFPTMNVYGASKHAVTNLTEMLRQELVQQKSPIKVTSVSPGAVLTEIFNLESFPPEVAGQLKDMPFMESQDIADAVLCVLGTPQHVQITELTIRPTGSPF